MPRQTTKPGWYALLERGEYQRPILLCFETEKARDLFLAENKDKAQFLKQSDARCLRALPSLGCYFGSKTPHVDHRRRWLCEQRTEHEIQFGWINGLKETPSRLT
jgi:hypothetical protein